MSLRDIAAALGDRPLEPLDEREFDAGAPRHTTVAGFDFDLESIQRRKDILFPFLTAELTFLDEIRDRERTRELALGDPLRPRSSSPRLPLGLSDDELQQVVDGAWARRHRWRAFAEAVSLAGRHDADDGRLPELFRGYVDQNILQPYCDSDTREPRFWAMLQNAAEHADFVEFVSAYAREHPSSRSTTELLFLLDELVEASRDALLLLLALDPQELVDTARSNPAGVGLARQLQQHYRDRVERQGLKSAEAITAWFDALRLRLLTTIVATTPNGYRSADARFLAGQVLFGQGDLEGARTWWSAITPDAHDSYFPVLEAPERPEVAARPPVEAGAPRDGCAARPMADVVACTPATVRPRVRYLLTGAGARDAAVSIRCPLQGAGGATMTSRPMTISPGPTVMSPEEKRRPSRDRLTTLQPGGRLSTVSA